MKDSSDRIRDRINRKRFAAHGRSLEQRQTNKRSLQPRSISLDDAVTVEGQCDERELGPPSGIANDTNHEARLATFAASAGFAVFRPRSCRDSRPL